MASIAMESILPSKGRALPWGNAVVRGRFLDFIHANWPPL
jgi:hypothetical protein